MNCLYLTDVRWREVFSRCEAASKRLRKYLERSAGSLQARANWYVLRAHVLVKQLQWLSGMSNPETSWYLQKRLHTPATVTLLTRGLRSEGYTRQKHADGVCSDDPCLLLQTLSVGESIPRTTKHSPSLMVARKHAGKVMSRRAASFGAVCFSVAPL